MKQGNSSGLQRKLASCFLLLLIFTCSADVVFRDRPQNAAGQSGLLRIYAQPSQAQSSPGGSPSQTPAAPSSTDAANEGQNNRTQPTAKKDEFSFFKIVLGMLAGLVLFLYGVTRLSDALKAVASERMEDFLSRFTTNRFAGVGTGIVATTLLDSSSVTIIMVIALVNAGLLKFGQAIGVIMGSNIGTTVSSQLYAFDLDEYSPIALLIGFLLHVLTKSERWQQIGLAVFSLGLVFFGLHQMSEAVEPLRDYPPFIGWMRGLESPIYGALAGAAFTVLIQSSSATLGVVIALAGQGLITLPAGIAVMLGAEIGTCADTLIASIGRSRGAIRAAVFHLSFNLVTVALGLTFVNQLTAFVLWLSGGAGVERQVANAHITFNTVGVLLFIPFTETIAAGLKRVIPPDDEERANEAGLNDEDNGDGKESEDQNTAAKPEKSAEAVKPKESVEAADSEQQQPGK